MHQLIDVLLHFHMKTKYESTVLLSVCLSMNLWSGATLMPVILLQWDGAGRLRSLLPPAGWDGGGSCWQASGMKLFYGGWLNLFSSGWSTARAELYVTRAESPSFVSLSPHSFLSSTTWYPLVITSSFYPPSHRWPIFQWLLILGRVASPLLYPQCVSVCVCLCWRRVCICTAHRLVRGGSTSHRWHELSDK